MLHLYKKQALMTFCALMIAAWQTAMADDLNSYYNDADGTKGAGLKTALCDIIFPHTNIGYNGLWEAYKTTDVREDGKLRDWYSKSTNYVIGGSKEGVNYKKEGDSYNREHTVPQSWFSEASPMKADAFHVVPTDGYVNNRRSNYPFGEVGDDTDYVSNGGYCKLGACVTSGYSGKVFEPGDDIKGDLARIYFYMVTCYQNKCTSWSGGIFTKSAYPGLAQWTLDMMMRWSEEDPVDDVEIARNEAVYELQHNRNPFVDFPGLEQYVWGSRKTTAFYVDDYMNPTGIEEMDNETITRDQWDDYYYNMSGQKFETPTKGGIYIYHGKKIYVR